MIALPAAGMIYFKYFYDTATTPQQVLGVAQKLLENKDKPKENPAGFLESIAHNAIIEKPIINLKHSNTAKNILRTGALGAGAALLFYGLVGDRSSVQLGTTVSGSLGFSSRLLG